MSATNRKIDTKADPANDPAMEAFKRAPAGRLQSMLAELQQDNPIAKPDRPHPPTNELIAASAPVPHSEVLPQSSVSSPAHVALVEPMPVTEPPVHVADMKPAPSLVEDAPPVSTVETSVAKAEAMSAQSPVVDQASASLAQQPEARASEQPVNWDKPVSQEAGALSLPEPEKQKRGRGRPRVSEERKIESSFTLSPNIAERMRDLAAYNQIRLKRTVSTSEIVEYLLAEKEKEIKDNVVLPH